MTALDDLIAAVEAGTMHDGHVIRTAIVSQMGGWVVAAFTGDLNAALRLHEALLPGWGWETGVNATFTSIAQVWKDGRSSAFQGVSEFPARSWLLAILRALKAKEAGNE